MRILAVVWLGVAFWTSSAVADECSDSKTQYDFNVCSAKELQRSEHELDGLYREIRDRLQNSPALTDALETAQTAWFAFRDAECLFATANISSGSVYPMVSGNCRKKLTRARIESLKSYLQCTEGDPSCPVPSR